ncbi:FKBP-type peptidyl-prolyl cis-trans isomerase [Sphingosinicella rhizophila]|uniref:Peptidyl-prolyl cis-trans isomerase n=1 Tax=Sphingosinicella rhizophila TaxID=3050082 RepID=A0ABU3Q7M9_9SPHN|nr:FKBP-type peptidyl-prolyl cis-trans isomerase [Sphingosinicella sp. GR2756]MDT9599408.1 FKBP-type peptidyl-prolyl cis-trans isomerase [Sphingosinicella sp. GR2756]
MSVTTVPIRPVKKGSVLKLWVGVGALCLAAAGVAWAGTEGQLAADPATFLARNAQQNGVVTTQSGLQYKLLQQGKGAKPTMTDVVAVDYEGRLTDGTMFESTAQNGGPATFPVMGVVPGFSEAVQLMQRGTKLRIWLPPELGYGPEEKRDPRTDEVVIPANAVLQFDMTLVDFQPVPPEQLEQLKMMQMLQQSQQGQPTP